MMTLDFANGVTGTLATVRATPLYWRIHVFGTIGSAEVLDEVTIVIRKSGAEPQRKTFPAIDVLRAELDAFADAIESKTPFPVPEADVLATVAAFEASLRSMTSGAPVECHGD
jgi:predicted dehydrogenase